MNRRRWAAVAAVAAVLGLAVAVPQAFAVTGDARPAGSARSALAVAALPAVYGRASVTLVTGDRVAVDHVGRVAGVTMGPGRSAIRWFRQLVNGHTFVVPADAMSLLRAGRLDRRLFDVTRLVADGYDDAHQTRIPLIVSYTGGADRRATAERTLAAADADVHRDLPALSAQALSADRRNATQVWRALTVAGSAGGEPRMAAGVEHVWLDGVVRAESTTTMRAMPGTDGAGTAQIGATDAWQAGFDGKGVTVAVLDSGIDATHPDLKGRIVAARDFSGSGSTDDRVGHGTHVASTIAGSGAASAGRYRGVAPGARLLNGKVLGDTGAGSDSDIIAGMQWAANSGARVINMSLGGVDSPGADPLEEAVNRLSAAKGVLFALAAGNEGPDATTLDTPGSAAAAITVAAVDHDDRLASFSSRGPTADDLNLKPDISAPGVDIVGAKAVHGAIGDGADTKGYVTMSGTSMATPHVAGAAAILAQEHPDWTGARIKAALMGSAAANAELTAYEQGAGRVDLTHGIAETVVAETASLGFGTQRWPHTDDTPVTRTLIYRNTGPTPATLRLSTSGASGVFTVSPATLIVPAGGTATATATANAAGADADGIYSGAVTATTADGTLAVRTPGLVNREAESYNLTLRSVGRDGKAPPVANADIYSLDRGKFYAPYEWDTDGDYRVTVRLPKGRYLLDDMVDDTVQSVLVAPNLVLDRDTTLVLDHRKAKRIKITAPARRAQGGAQILQWAAQGTKKEYTYAMGVPTLDTFVAQVGPNAGPAQFLGQIAGVWKGRAATAPQYHIVVSRKGSFFTGLARTVVLSSMARVDLAIGATVADYTTQPSGDWTTPGFPQLDGFSPGTEGATVALPTARTAMYVTADNGLRWALTFNLYRGSAPHVYAVTGDLAPRRYQPGHTYRRTYNRGVFGPTVGPGDTGGSRRGNAYSFCIPMLSDGNMALDATATKKTTLTAAGRTYLQTDQDTCMAEVGLGLPAQKTRYTLSTDWRRSLRTYRVSDRVTATWTFTSQYYTAAGWQRLPLSNVRFTPRLSLTNTTEAGQTVKIPITVQGAAASRGVKTWSVSVSYDGGHTWRTARVKGAGATRAITLTYPGKPGTVSFRTALTDADGNGFTSTVTNAYRLVR